MLNTQTLPALTGDLVAPGAPEWDLARRAWQLIVDQRPALVALPADAGDVQAVMADAATPHGLFPLAGSSPDVGVVGYTLGGGPSWLARKHGLAGRAQPHPHGPGGADAGRMVGNHPLR